MDMHYLRVLLTRIITLASTELASNALFALLLKYCAVLDHLHHAKILKSLPDMIVFLRCPLYVQTFATVAFACCCLDLSLQQVHRLFLT